MAKGNAVFGDGWMDEIMRACARGMARRRQRKWTGHQTAQELVVVGRWIKAWRDGGARCRSGGQTWKWEMVIPTQH